MAGSRDHIVTGGGTLVCRVLQLLCSIAVIGLAGYGLYYLRFSGVQLNMAAACITFACSSYFIIATTVAPRLYNYWAALVFDFVAFSLWVASFGLMVYQVRPFYVVYYDFDGCDWFYYGVCFDKRSSTGLGLIEKRDGTNWYTYRNTMGGIAALAGLEWIMFFITLATVSVCIAQHRRQGGRATYNSHSAKYDVEKSVTDARDSIASHPSGVAPPAPTVTA